MDKKNVDILLIEDNPNDIELALYAFTKNKIVDRVRIVRDGFEALEFMYCEHRYALRDRTEGPKIILLDLKIPKINGLDVLRRLKQDERTKTIPVIVLSTSHEYKDVNTSYAFGVNSYIVKPVEYEEFEHAIRSIIHYWLNLNLLPFDQ